MERLKEKICAVVVTYNRKDLLQEALDALLNQTYQLDSIIIVNNASTDRTEEILKEKYLDNKIFDYFNTGENIGGAGGFHEGMKIAYEQGFDWIWLMDDDGKLELNALEEILKNIDIENKMICYNCLVVDNRKNGLLSFNMLEYSSNIIYKKISDVKKEKINGFSPFNGTLLSKKIIKKVGFVKKELFIWGDEREYGIRLIKNNINIQTITKSIINHPGIIDKHKKTIFGDLMLGIPAWKIYYLYRNRIFILKNYSSFLTVIYKIPIMILKGLIIILLYDNNKINKLKAFFIGIYHGVINKLGKNDKAFNY